MVSLVSHVIVIAMSAALFSWIKKLCQPYEGGQADVLLNSAFVFVKPHANTAATQELVRNKLTESDIKIVSEIDIKGTTIDEKKLIDQHYYAIGRSSYALSKVFIV